VAPNHPVSLPRRFASEVTTELRADLEGVLSRREGVVLVPFQVNANYGNAQV
jgi:hypothetical protein